jgi:uncharacterized membrane protein YdbT with pleckstrin-like domain
MMAWQGSRGRPRHRLRLLTELPGRDAFMSYVEETLGSDERIIHVARFHWFYTFSAIVILIVLGPLLIGIVIFLVMMIRKWTTEIAVTNMRFVYKRGWISRQTEEMSLHRIEEVNLDQSIFGRIFGYGKLRLSGTGVGTIMLPSIDDPLALRRAIQEAKPKAD